MSAVFTIESIDGSIVTIRDIGHEYGPSVTNDAENVVHKLLQEYGNRRFFYYDSDNELGELVHNGRDFVTFGFPQDFS